MERLAERIVAELPERLAGYRELLATDGIIMPGAVSALAAVQQTEHLIATVVTGNLRGSEDVRTGLEGGARVIAIASGTTTGEQLRAAGAQHVLPDLTSASTLLRLIDQVQAP
ncbi:HAD hydrolase-like protein [Streptomyces antibioticus]|uniref:HAD hydrolase-like protein n=1 Tax=Streptomyces antibioticus TaxID=1890 RepID=UPI0036CD4576